MCQASGRSPDFRVRVALRGTVVRRGARDACEAHQLRWWAKPLQRALFGGPRWFLGVRCPVSGVPCGCVRERGARAVVLVRGALRARPGKAAPARALYGVLSQMQR